MTVEKGFQLHRREIVTLAGVVAAGTMARPGAAAQATDDVHLGPGEHAIDRDRTIAGTLTVSPGARIRIARGATITLTGDLVAPAMPIFAGEGRIDLTGSRIVAARPEWWGAVPDAAQVDCCAGIEAALAAHIAVQLGPGDYHLARELVVDRPNRRLWGVGRTSDAGGTRLLRIGPTGAVLRIGPAAAPGAINSYLRGVDVRWLELGRTAAPAADGRGVVVQYVLDALLEGLRAVEHGTGFTFRGAVRSFAQDCAAFRSLFPGRPDDSFIGFDLDGSDPPIATGSNASLFLVDCSARTGNRPGLAGAVGCRMRGACSDTALVRFETTELGEGVVIEGGGGGGAARHRYAQLDIRLDAPVLDQCGRAGIAIRNLGGTAMVDIAAPWISLRAGAEAGVHMRATGGATSITGGQLVATGKGPSTGILIDAATGVSLAATKLLDFTRPVVAKAASGFDLAPVILPGAPIEAAVALAGCDSGTVRPRVLRGGDTAAGVALDPACHAVAVETAGLAGARQPVRHATARQVRPGETVIIA